MKKLLFAVTFISICLTGCQSSQEDNKEKWDYSFRLHTLTDTLIHPVFRFEHAYSQKDLETMKAIRAHMNSVLGATQDALDNIDVMDGDEWLHASTTEALTFYQNAYLMDSVIAIYESGDSLWVDRIDNVMDEFYSGESQLNTKLNEAQSSWESSFTAEN